MNLPVRYNAAVGSVFLVLSVFILGTAMLTQTTHLLLIGGLNIGVSLGFLTQPMFVVTPGQIEMRNMLGMTLKTHDYVSLADLEIDGANLVRKSDGQRLARVGPIMTRAADVAALRRAIDNAS